MAKSATVKRETVRRSKTYLNAKSKLIEPMEMDLAPPDTVDLPPDGPLDPTAPVIQRQTDVFGFKDKAEALKFYEEKCVVVIHESTDPNAEPHVPLGVNGRMIWLQRGLNYLIARKYVERLARAKPINVATVPALDHEGTRITRIAKTSAVLYPFSVVRDDNPRGREWLRNIMAQP